SLWRTVYRVYTQGGKFIGQVNELSKGKVVDKVTNALDKAGSGAVVQAENVTSRDALAKALSENGNLRGPEKHPGYPEHVHPDTGGFSDVHVQTAQPKAMLAALFAPNFLSISNDPCASLAELLSAGLWDLAVGLDPLFVTDVLAWYYGVETY